MGTIGLPNRHAMLLPQPGNLDVVGRISSEDGAVELRPRLAGYCLARRIGASIRQ